MCDSVNLHFESIQRPTSCLAISESVEVTSPAEDAVELETPVKEEAPLPVDPGWW